MSNEWIGISEVVRITGVGSQTIRDWMDKGKFGEVQRVGPKRERRVLQARVLEISDKKNSDHPSEQPPDGYVTLGSAAHELSLCIARVRDLIEEYSMRRIKLGKTTFVMMEDVINAKLHREQRKEDKRRQKELEKIFRENKKNEFKFPKDFVMGEEPSEPVDFNSGEWVEVKSKL